MKRKPADKIFSDIIRTRDNWTCQRCNKTINRFSSEARQGLHCSHFIGRGKYNTRFDEKNCVALCYGCHRYFTSYPIEHLDFFSKRMGSEELASLHQRSNARTGGGLPLRSFYNSTEHIKRLKERLRELG